MQVADPAAKLRRVSAHLNKPVSYFLPAIRWHHCQVGQLNDKLMHAVHHKSCYLFTICWQGNKKESSRSGKF